MYNKATKTSGFYINFVKEGEKTQMEINADILINVPLCFCSFDFIIQGAMNIKMWPSLLEWSERMEDNRPGKRFKARVLTKTTFWSNKIKVVSENQPNKNSRENPDQNWFCSSFPLFVDFDASQHLN